jgi:hypothetical protein
VATKGRYYELGVKNADKNLNNIATPQTIYARIYDLSLEDNTTTEWEVITLTGSGDPIRISTVDNSEDKFTGLKPLQATIKFLSTNSVNINTFTTEDLPTGGVDVGDPRWRVEIFYNTYDPLNIIFEGFLNLDDCYEPFLPVKNEVTLVANDGLGGLKNTPLTDFNGDNPTGYNRIADYLAWALSKTGLELPLKAVFNIREYTQSTSHFFDAIYLHAKTFEDKIGTCINCYDALERILGEMAFLTQRGGEWWIFRIDEMAGTNPYYTATFNADGTFDSIDSGFHYPKFIGVTENIKFSQEATTVHPLRSHQSIKELFRFEFPDEIVDNIDFSRGDFQNFNSGTLVAKYDIADWEALEGSGGIPGTGSPSSTQNYIKRVFLDTNMTYESERYVVIEGTASGGTFFIKSNPIPVHQNDKIDVSVDARFSVDVFPSSGFVRFNTIQVRLTADDGTYYTLHGGTSVDKNLEWRITGASFSSNNRYFVIEGDSSEDLTKFKTATWFTDSVEQFPCPPIPKDGYLEILLIHDQNSSYNTDRYFSNLRFTYVPYINGSYSKYSTYYYKISQDIKQVNARDKQVYIGDSPKKLFKGSLFKKVGAAYVLTNQFYGWNDIHTTSPDIQYVHPYAHIQAYDVWNQHRNSFIKFQGTMQGLDGASVDDNGYINPPHLINTYFLLDTNGNTDNRQFMLLSFDIDFYSCEWKGTLIEVYNSVKGKSYLDNLEIKYEQ